MAYANAFRIKNPVSFKVDDVEYADQVWVVTGTAEEDIQQQRTFGGVDVDTDEPIWTLAITGHNWMGTGGLAKAIDDARIAGDTMEVVVQFQAGTGKPVVTCTVKPVAVPFGGEVGRWHQMELELPVIDQPVRSLSA